jgi:membrane protease YdiL (CAAX protease family)
MWLFLSVLFLWLLLDRTAAALGSFRGEAGVVVCVVVLAAALAVELIRTRRSPRSALAELGLRPSRRTALLRTGALCVVMLGFFPLYALGTGDALVLRDGVWLLVPGLFAQGGITEEVVFRGYLFRHMREGRTFRQAAIAAAVPFIAVHLLLFLSLEPAVALAALFVAVAISFPLAWLYERAGNSIWPGALLHSVVQGSIKLVETDGSYATVALAWMALCVVAPWALFLLLRPQAAVSSSGDSRS